MSLENPHWVDVSCDDYVTLYTQHSTQWDSLSHVGRFFDADGDGKDEIVYYSGGVGCRRAIPQVDCGVLQAPKNRDSQ